MLGLSCFYNAFSVLKSLGQPKYCCCCNLPKMYKIELTVEKYHQKMLTSIWVYTVCQDTSVQKLRTITLNWLQRASCCAVVVSRSSEQREIFMSRDGQRIYQTQKTF